MKMSDKLLIRKYRIRCLFIFITMILVFITFSVTDTKRLFFIQEQRDTILIKDLTLEQLNGRIKKMTERLEKKEQEIIDLKRDLEILKTVANEKNRGIIKPIDSLSIVIGAEGDVIQIRK
jgi:hypothetical protein